MFRQFKETLQTRHSKGPNVGNGVPSNASSLTDQRSPVTAKDAGRKIAEGLYLPFNVQDLVKAELAILKFVQSSAFSEEIRVLEGLEIEKKSVGNRPQGRKKASVKNNSPSVAWTPSWTRVSSGLEVDSDAKIYHMKLSIL